MVIFSILAMSSWLNAASDFPNKNTREIHLCLCSCSIFLTALSFVYAVGGCYSYSCLLCKRFYLILNGHELEFGIECLPYCGLELSPGIVAPAHFCISFSLVKMRSLDLAQPSPLEGIQMQHPHSVEITSKSRKKISRSDEQISIEVLAKITGKRTRAC